MKDLVQPFVDIFPYQRGNTASSAEGKSVYRGRITMRKEVLTENRLVAHWMTKSPFGRLVVPLSIYFLGPTWSKTAGAATLFCFFYLNFIVDETRPVYHLVLLSICGNIHNKSEATSQFIFLEQRSENKKRKYCEAIWLSVRCGCVESNNTTRNKSIP